MKQQLFVIFALFIASSFAFLLKGNIQNRIKWSQGDFTGPKWQNRTAAEKKAMLWAAITSDTKSNTWYSVAELAEIFIESMNTTIISHQDEMPHQGPFDLLTRKKLVHTVGAVAQAVFKPNQVAASRGYTGGFKGSNNLLVRVSLAAAPTNTTITPGVAFKFLRNGVLSGNMFTMYSLAGQESFNFFENDFHNHIPQISPNAPTALKALRAKFATASQWPEMTGLSKVSLYTESGEAETKPVFPFVVRMSAPQELKNKFPKQKTSQTLEQQMATLPEGTLLYNVLAQAEPNAEFEQIGEIVTTSKFTSSNFGDRGLFFEHAVVENDLVYRPDWRKALP